MGKHVKLPPPKNAKKPQKAGEKDGFFFFVKDQGEGAGKVAVIILKVIELILTTIFALVLGIFGPLCILFGLDRPDIAANPSAIYWLVSSILYIIGLFIVMMGHSKVATVVHLLALVGTMLTYVNYTNMFKDVPNNNGPTALYMPCIFITIVTVGIMLIINIPKWIDKHTQKENEVAPSILGDRKKQ